MIPMENGTREAGRAYVPRPGTAGPQLNFTAEDGEGNGIVEGKTEKQGKNSGLTDHDPT